MGRSTTWNNNNASKGPSSAVLIGRSATLNNNKASKGTSNAEFNTGRSATWNNDKASKGTSSAEFNLGRSATWNNDKASKGTSSGIDRISNLPGPLITRILSLLPTKCAVATSVLSTKWRFSWTSVTNLDFNDSGYYPKKALNMKKIEFTKFVNRVLLLLNPPCIQNFRLKCRQELSDPFYLQSWICAAIGRTVGELVLAFDLKSNELMELPFSRMHCKVVVLKLKGDIYFNIPAQASICFPNLKKLHLSKIKIEIAQNSVVSFPNLKILHLSDVDYENENSVHKIFSSCPILDDLVIKRESWDKDNVHCLTICIPSLTRLELDYQFSDRVDSDDHDTLQVDKLHNLKSLIILGDALKVVRTASSNISSGFHNLTHLELEKEDCSDWSAVIKDLLGNMDNLEHLTMKGGYCYKNHGQSWWTEPCNVPTCLLSRVTTISFDYMISDCCDELEMLRYFLKNAEILELLTINTKQSCVEKKLKLFEKVCMFSRGSRSCQVAFT